MTFTYAGTLTTDLDKVRFYIQDTTSSSGPKPDGVNFTDAELNGLLTTEGSVGRAVAACFETLAAVWRTRYNFTSDGQNFQRAAVADGFQALADQWRTKYGSGASTVTTSAVTRVDAYSDDVASDEV
jgi:hypothetical protein